jgi:hypothetical protein
VDAGRAPRRVSLAHAASATFKREIMTQAMIDGLSNLAQIVGVMQSLLGAILLFLIGLALRNRFRMK